MTHINYKHNKTILFDSKVYTLNHSLIFVLEDILSYSYRTFEGYMKAYKKLHGNSYLIPIMLFETCYLIPMFGYRSHENTLINYFEIERVIRHGMSSRIYFKNRTYVDINKPLKLILKQIKRASIDLHTKKTFSLMEIMNL